MDLFEIEQTISPERQWRDLCESAGVKIEHTDEGKVASIDHYAGVGDNAFDAIIDLWREIKRDGKRPAFPGYYEWRIDQMRKP